MPPLLLVLAVLAGDAPVPTHGDAVGEVTSTSAVVWTRASRAARVEVRVGLTPDLAGARRFGPVPTGPGLTAQVKVTGLAPGRRHYYRTRLGDPADPGRYTDGALGTFRTAPAAAARVRFTFSADIDAAPPHPILREIQAEHPDFHVFLGDAPYADGARTLADYRRKHAALRRAPDLIALLHATACYWIHDDHEVANDWDAGTPAALVRNGRAAWQEWVPLVPAAPGVHYRTFAWGPGLRIFLLDTRSHRGYNVAADNASHTMLGAPQLAWLERELLAARETFKVIFTSVPLRSGLLGRDSWEGYQHERRSLFAFLRDHGIANVVFLSGDHHFAAVNHHPEGFVEALAGPVKAALVLPPPDREPFMRSAVPAPNYGRVTVDPAASPPALEIVLASGGAVIGRARVEARRPARLGLLAGLGDGLFHVAGPRHYGFRGAGTDLAGVPPGRYRIHAGARAGPRAFFPPVTLDVPEDGYAAAGFLPRVTPGRERSRRFAEDFEQTDGRLPKGAVVVDEGLSAGPSSWFTDGGRLWQSSLAFGPDIFQPATHIVFGDASWTDQVVRTRLRSGGGQNVGVLFRYRDPANYYYFVMNHALPARALIARVRNLTHLLAFDATPTPVDQWLEVECAALGDRLRVKVDGQPIFDVKDARLARGKVGYAVWAAGLTAFDALRVHTGPAEEGTRFEDHFASGTLAGWTVRDEGTRGRGAWRVVGGQLVQTARVRGPGRRRPGTSLLRTAPAVRDASFSLRMRTDSSGGVGALFRVAAPDTGYRFQLDAAAGFARLEKVVKGAHAVLAEDRTRTYEPFRWYRVEILAEGARLAVRLDGEEVVAALDGAIAAGGVGLYCFDNDRARFDDVVVRRLGGDAPVTTVSGRARVFQVAMRARAARGDAAQPLLATAIRPAVDLAPFDPEGRLLPLAPDALLHASLVLFNPQPFDPTGTATFLLRFPPDPALAGLRLFVGGVRRSPGARLQPLATAPLRL